jgi:hypothetical protein
MLTEFAAIVEQIVRGAEELRRALLRAQGDLARTAASLQEARGAGQSGTVLNLDRMGRLNAREISQALLEGSGIRGSATQSTSTASSAESLSRPLKEVAGQTEKLRDQLRQLQPGVEGIAQHLRDGQRRFRPVRGRAPSLLQRMLTSRRGQAFRWKLERSRSPLRRYVGQSLSRYAERGNLRRMFLELSRAPAAMRTKSALQQAARAGMTAQQLARGAQVVGLAGRVGGMAAAAAGVAMGPVGAAVAATVVLTVAMVKAAQAVYQFVRAQDNVVFEINRVVQNFSGVNAGFAALDAQFQANRLREAQRVAGGTYTTTAAYAQAAERYRREGEDLRILGQNISNLWGIARLQLFELVKITTGIKVLEKLAGPLNEMIRAVLRWLGWSEDKNKEPLLDWLDRYRVGQVGMPRRKAPPEPFNRGPKK